MITYIWSWKVWSSIANLSFIKGHFQGKSVFRMRKKEFPSDWGRAKPVRVQSRLMRSFKIGENYERTWWETVREKEKKNTGSHVGKNVKEALRHNCQALAQVCLASSVKYPIHWQLRHLIDRLFFNVFAKTQLQKKTKFLPSVQKLKAIFVQKL